MDDIIEGLGFLLAFLIVVSIYGAIIVVGLIAVILITFAIYFIVDEHSR